MSTIREPIAQRDRRGRLGAPPTLSYRTAKRLSWGFVAVAAGLAALFAVQIGRFEAAAPARPEAEPSRPTSDQIVAVDSTLTGFDSNHEPYSVSAAGAVQDAAEPDLVHLDTVTAELRRRSGDVLSLAAQTALYDSTAKTLDLEGRVRLGAGDRLVAEMDRAQVHLEDKRLRSEVPVVASFDRGRIVAGGLEISHDGSRIVFFNRAKAVFEPAKSDKQP